ncbi:hypothetical protein SEEHRA36_23380 [Salmonella enterica subsp. enterica serovar Heidelberg str. SARA36]|nr:group II intron maturase-specific domain-containing protein [Salmonella enterica]KJS99139.1 hypothetical protein SEEHRA36_23380 [Salmonella enterica subsp. enterica serovar Heidelberg str. SARA36]
MPNKRIVMRKIHEILRLRFEVGLSFRQISQCADVSTGTIQKMLKRLEASGISWPLPEGMSEPRLASLLYPESGSRPGALEDPDWAEIHMELRKKGVTRHLLWEEYCQRMPVRAYRKCMQGASNAAMRKITGTIKNWRIHRSTVESLLDFARRYNAIVRGWTEHYGKFWYRNFSYRLWSTMQSHLLKWMQAKYRLSSRKAQRKLTLIRKQYPKLFAHWYLLRATSE